MFRRSLSLRSSHLRSNLFATNKFSVSTSRSFWSWSGTFTNPIIEAGALNPTLIKPLEATQTMVAPNAITTNLIQAELPTSLAAPILEPPQIPLEPVTDLLQSPLVESITKLADFQSLGLGHSTPSGLIELALEWTHLTTGLPWWLSILLITITIRTLLIPTTIWGQTALSKLKNIKPQTEVIQKEIKRFQASGDTNSARLEMDKMREVFKTNKVNPLGGFWMFVQMPIMISFFVALQNMASVGVPGMSTEGLFWFTNLSVADPYFILPVVGNLAILASVEADQTMNSGKNMIRAMLVLTIPLMAWMPACVFVYAITSGCFNYIQGRVLRSENVREYLRIPKVDAKAAVEAGMMSVNPLTSSAIRQVLMDAKTEGGKK